MPENTNRVETFGPFLIHAEPVTVEEWLDATEAEVADEAQRIAEATALAEEELQRDADIIAGFCLTGFGHTWSIAYEFEPASAVHPGHAEVVECDVCGEQVAR